MQSGFDEEARMNVGRLIGGLICLAAAVLLGVLMVTLPEGKVVFMVGDRNLPIIPVTVLAILGLGLVVTAWRR
jgi:uncharacterized membrane protein YccC